VPKRLLAILAIAACGKARPGGHRDAAVEVTPRPDPGAIAAPGDAAARPDDAEPFATPHSANLPMATPLAGAGAAIGLATFGDAVYVVRPDDMCEVSMRQPLR
jgi:hypothetical protein